MKNSIIYLAAALLSLSACKKGLMDKYEASKNSNSSTLAVKAEKMSDIKVPAGFKWELSRDVQIKISTTDNRFGNAIQKLMIYSANPAVGGVKLSEGALSSTSPFEAKINVANTITEFYLVKVAPDQSKIIEKVAINNNNVSATITATANVVLGKTASGPDCTTGCTTTINNASGSQSFSSGTKCLTGTAINISKLTISGTAIVRICGTGSINDVEFSSSSAQLIITATGHINFTQTVAVDEGTFTNYGILSTNINNNFNVNSTATFVNNGTCTFGKDFNPNGSSIITNNGSIEVASKLINSANCTFTNACKLIVHNDFQNNGTFYNYGYIRCDMETSILGGSNQVFKQYNGAMIYTNDIQVNGTITGIGTTSLIKVIDQSKGNNQGVVNGSQTYCDLNGIEALFNASITGGANQGCSLYIAVSACNPAGNGTIAITDTDGDGVSDASDCYPADPNKAFCNPYGTSTVAFEDLWPSKGDYDLNDVVVTYNYNVITNASNHVVRVEATYVLRATGGSFNNGFAVQFPINRSLVSGVTGATLEAGQTKAVLVIFNNMRAEMDVWNTIPTQASSPVRTYTVGFNITSGPLLSTFGLSGYNPFIWNGTTGFGRGYEIHLPGYLPTDLATANIFGTYDDATNISSGDTYVSKNGRFPWAINIPATFNYPIEKADINTAYLKFASWVSSGGTQYNDWYSNTTGYRNAAKIY
ncbi:MAG: LruC domain-containing protein [Bacteroidia bacterium]|nr:LruC domain-containing protein [Bacteroidia bacterium]